MKNLRASWCVVGSLMAWFLACSAEDDMPPPSGPSGSGNASSSGGASAPASSGGAPGSGGNATGGPSTSGGTPPGGGNSAGAGGSSPVSGGAPPVSGGSAGTAASGGSSGAPVAGMPGGGAPGGGSAGLSSVGGGSGGGAVVDEPELVTSADDAFWKVGSWTMGATGTAAVTVSATGTQSWLGFGGTFNEAGWDALSVLPEDQRLLAIRLLFDAVDGAKLDYGRIPIGASDYAMSKYTLAETPGDTQMASFSLARDREKLIPYIQAALAVKPNIRFWASPWTPPAWLKTNNSTDAVAGQKPPYDDTDGVMKKDDDSLGAFALYLTKFVQEYAKLGITVGAIHPQNEPGYGNPYPSCYWPSELYIRFIREFLGPKFEKELPTTEIWGGTMSAPEDGDMAVALSNDAAAMKYVKGFGLQWNTRDKVSTLRAKNLPVMQTEHKCGNYNFMTDYWEQGRYDPNKPQNDYAYAVESWKNIRDWVRSGVNAYSAWNMVLDTLGKNLNATTPWHQNALLVVDRNAKTLIETPAYYVFRHLSQYVDPMSTVLGTTGGDALAFKNPDGSFVVVVYNEGAAKPGMVVDVAGTKLSFDMPANGWATINLAN